MFGVAVRQILVSVMGRLSKNNNVFSEITIACSEQKSGVQCPAGQCRLHLYNQINDRLKLESRLRHHYKHGRTDACDMSCRKLSVSEGRGLNKSTNEHPVHGADNGRIKNILLSVCN